MHLTLTLKKKMDLLRLGIHIVEIILCYISLKSSQSLKLDFKIVCHSWDSLIVLTLILPWEVKNEMLFNIIKTATKLPGTQ